MDTELNAIELIKEVNNLVYNKKTESIEIRKLKVDAFLDKHDELFVDENYYKSTKKHLLAKLSDYLLADELRDKKKNKNKTNEYPFLSLSQYNRITSKESLIFISNNETKHTDDTIDYLVNLFKNPTGLTNKSSKSYAKRIRDYESNELIKSNRYRQRNKDKQLTVSLG